MPTDWPGHRQNNQFPHIAANCWCQIWFTHGQEPPWAYLMTVANDNTNAWWSFLGVEHYVSPNKLTPFCHWRRLTLSGGDTKLIRLLPQLDLPADELIINLQVSHTAGIQISTAENIFRTGILLGDEIPRGTEFVFPSSAWVPLQNSPIDEGTPDIDITAVPVDCIPGWNWGDTIP